MSLFDDLFGGTDKFSAEETIRSNARRADDVVRLAERARGDVMKLFPQSQNVLSQGIDSALGVQRDFMPAQIDAYKQGNQQAQKSTMQGLAGINAALMGLPMNLTAENLTSRGVKDIDYDPAMFDRQQPDYKFGDEIGIDMTPFFSRNAAWYNPAYVADYTGLRTAPETAAGPTPPAKGASSPQTIPTDTQREIATAPQERIDNQIALQEQALSSLDTLLANNTMTNAQKIKLAVESTEGVVDPSIIAAKLGIPVSSVLRAFERY